MNPECSTTVINPLLSVAERQEANIQRAKLVAATTNELCELFCLEPGHAREVFEPACVRHGNTHYPNLYDRAQVCELLSEWNGKEIGYPFEPLLRPKKVRALLAELGTPRSAVTIWRLEQKGMLVPMRIRTALRYHSADVLRVSESLKLWTRNG